MTSSIVFLDKSTFPDHINFRLPEGEHQWRDYDVTSENQIVERAKSATIIVSNKVILNAEIIQQLPNLKHIAVIATGYNNVDIDACQTQGISVSNIRNYGNDSVSEHAMSLIFSLRRHLFAYREAVQNGKWQRSPSFCYYHGQTLDIKGSRLGIVGGGGIGKAMAALAKSIGMKTWFADRKGQAASGRDGYVNFERLIQESDVISLHCPLNAETEDLITTQELKAMQSNALLINMARGGVVNEMDLVEAIQNKWIAGAASDVATTEPINNENPLLKIIDKHNFILTPHVAWTSDKALQTQANQLLEIIDAFNSGKFINRII